MMAGVFMPGREMGKCRGAQTNAPKTIQGLVEMLNAAEPIPGG